MTREEFVKRSFRAYMEVLYTSPRLEDPIPCMLLAVDFDRDVCFVEPFETNEYEPEGFWVSIDYLQFPPKKRMKVI